MILALGFSVTLAKTNTTRNVCSFAFEPLAAESEFSDEGEAMRKLKMDGIGPSSSGLPLLG